MASKNKKKGNKPLSLRKRYPYEYAIWAAMRQRCNNPNCKVYDRYGERGIEVCKRWSQKNGFEHFFGDMGPQPFPRASLHRVDNDGNYTPSNVIWADRMTQARNMSSNHLLTFKGKTQTIAAWAEEVGMRANTLLARLRRRWTVSAALTEPVDPRKPFTPWPPWRRRRR